MSFEPLFLHFSAGADVNQENSDGQTPLHLASKQGHVTVVHALLESEANRNAISANGKKTWIHVQAIIKTEYLFKMNLIYFQLFVIL